MKKFFSKKMNLLSVILAVLGLVGILVMLIVPHGGRYTRTDTVGDEKVVYCMELKDGKIYTSSKIDGEWTDAVELGSYTISKGKLYREGTLTNINVELGKINAFRYAATDSEEGKLTCTMTVVFFAIACAMAVVGTAGTVYGALKTNKKSTKAKSKK